MKIWLNGKILDESQALLPVTDRAVLFGDSLFETFRTYRRIPFRLEEHLVRLLASCAFLKLSLSCELDSIRSAVDELLKANSITDAAVRLAVTRGPVAGPLGLADSASGSVFMTLRAPGYPEELYQEGIRLILSTVRRNSFSPLSRHKTANFLDELLARQQALDAGVEDALMLDSAGGVAECTTANVFAVRRGVLITPPLSGPVLPGVTRAIVLQLCRQLSLTAREETLSLEALSGADEVFITNSVMELMPVRSLDGLPIGAGRPGPIYLRLHDAYRQLVRDECP